MTKILFKVLVFDNGWAPNWLGDAPGEDFDMEMGVALSKARRYSKENKTYVFGVAEQDCDMPEFIYVQGALFLQE